MSDAREEILSRVQAALRDVAAGEGPDDVPVPRAYRRQDPREREELVALLCERINDYAAQAERIAGEASIA